MLVTHHTSKQIRHRSNTQACHLLIIGQGKIHAREADVSISHCVHVHLLGLQCMHIDVVQIAVVPHLLIIDPADVKRVDIANQRTAINNLHTNKHAHTHTQTIHIS